MPAVQQIEGEHWRYHVASRTHGISYLVDLEEYGWNGACGCYDFEFRMRPALVRGAEPARRLRCWHIEQARDYAFRAIIPQIAQAINETKTKGKKNERQKQDRMDGRDVVACSWLHED